MKHQTLRFIRQFIRALSGPAASAESANSTPDLPPLRAGNPVKIPVSTSVGDRNRGIAIVVLRIA